MNLITIKEHEGKVVDYITEDRDTVIVHFTDGTRFEAKACCCISTDGEG